MTEKEALEILTGNREDYNSYARALHIAISLEVDTMSVPAFESLIVNNIVEAMTKALEQSVVSGDGNGKPKGIIKETVPDGQNINVDTQKYDDLINAEAALPVAYEQGAEWCMNKKTYMGY